MLVMEHYSALKRKEMLTTATVGMNLEGIMLSDISQSQQDSTVIPLTGGPERSQIHKQKVDGGDRG